MKTIIKKSLPIMLMLGVLAMSGMFASCKSSEQTMYGREKSNKARQIKSNIKVKGNNRTNSHTTRSY